MQHGNFSPQLHGSRGSIFVGPHFDRRKMMINRWQPILGVVLTIVGLVPRHGSQGIQPDQFSRFHSLLGFGGLLLFQVIGTHPQAAERRRLARESPRPPRPVPFDVPVRTFRYGTSGLQRSMAAGVCIVMGLAFAAFGILLGCIIRGDLGVRAFVGIGLTLFGLFLGYYGWRYLRVRIAISPAGIEARLYLHTVRMQWDEVLVLIERQIAVPLISPGSAARVVGAAKAGRVFWVYSLRDKLWFSDGLAESADLAETISRATGLEWT